MSLKLPLDAAGKVEQVLQEIHQRSDDLTERYQIALVAAGVCIRSATDALVAVCEASGEPISEDAAMPAVIELLGLTASWPPEAVLAEFHKAKQ